MDVNSPKSPPTNAAYGAGLICPRLLVMYEAFMPRLLRLNNLSPMTFQPSWNTLQLKRTDNLLLRDTRYLHTGNTLL